MLKTLQTTHLVTLAHRLAERLDRAVSTISRQAANDGKFIQSLEDGAGCTIRRANRVIAWFHENWPEGLEWPEHIERPGARPAAKSRRSAKETRK